MTAAMTQESAPEIVPESVPETAQAQPRRVVLCADDFAVHEAASQGIARLAEMGRISATSAMVLSPRWAVDAPRLYDLRGQIDVGLHLDWTSDFARAAGHGVSLGRAMLKSVLGGFNQAEARAVIERQLDAFEAQWKAPQGHVRVPDVHLCTAMRLRMLLVLR